MIYNADYLGTSPKLDGLYHKPWGIERGKRKKMQQTQQEEETARACTQCHGSFDESDEVSPGLCADCFRENERERELEESWARYEEARTNLRMVRAND